ncbi:MAG: MotA/TolQ/ExbB proton channel family protein, partial [Rikenellaceae bacterium]
MFTLLQTAEAVTKTIENVSQSIPASAADTSMGLGELIMKGGWLMIPLAILLGAFIFIFVERLRVINRASNIDVNFMNQIKDLMYEGKIKVALKVCKDTDSPIARMVEKGIEHLG